jgi:hypothetical protein
MRKIKTVALLAAFAAVSVQSLPATAQPEERPREWRDAAPDSGWLDREDRLWDRGGRNEIDCPLGQVRREITTPLPEGWWNTPTVDRLTGTDIQVIGGQRTLVCRYGSSGQIMRLEPRRRICTPTRRGFECRRSRPGGWPGGPGGPGGPGWPGGPGGPGGDGTYNSGSVELRQTYSVDLDSGRTSGGGADVFFHALNPLEMYLEPVGGARLAWMGGESGRRNCADADLRGDRISLGRVNIGTNFCYRTGDGRLGQFRVTGFSNMGSSRVIHLDFETWNGR